MRRAVATAAVLSLATLAPRAGTAAPPADGPARPHVDREAIAELRGGPAPMASAAAITHYLEGRQLARAGDWRGAAAALRLAVVYDEESAELRAALADALALSLQLTEAEGEARRAVALSGGEGRPASDAYVLLGELAAARGEIEEAIACLRAAERIQAARAGAGEPLDGTPWRALASLQLGWGDEAEAERELEDLEARAPGARGFLGAGRELLDRGKLPSAERFLRRAVELAPLDRDALRLLARAHFALGRREDLRDDLAAILRVDPDDAEALFQLGEEALDAGEVVPARAWFSRFGRASLDAGGAAARVASRWLEAGWPVEALSVARSASAAGAGGPRLAVVEGLSLLRLRRFGEAAAVLARIPPAEEEAWVPARAALGQALSRAGQGAAALRALAEPLRRRPGDARLVLARAAVLERAGRWREAADALAAAAGERERAGAQADADTDAATFTAQRADLLCRAGRPAEALAVLRMATEAHPRAPALLLARSSAQRAAGQAGAADAELRALLALAPDDAAAAARLASSLAARVDRPGDLEEAEVLARRAVRLAPRSAAAHDALGRVLARRGDGIGAVAALERAAALGEPDPGILDRLGDAYRAMGRSADAARVWRSALAAAADGPPAVEASLAPAVRLKLRGLRAERVRAAVPDLARTSRRTQ